MRIKLGFIIGVTISIPNALFRDINLYLETKIILNHNQGEYCFDKGSTYNNINGCFFYFLRQYNIIDLSEIKANAYVIEVVMRTSLQSMAQNGVNPILLETINDVMVDTLYKYYSTCVVKAEIDKLVNNKISKNKYYKYL